MRITLLKSGDYGSWAAEHDGTLPYRFDLLGRRVALIYSDAHLHGPWTSPPLVWLLGAMERRLPPLAQTLALLPTLRRSDAVLAMFESEGHFLAALRWLRVPGTRRPTFAIMSCWLTSLLATAGPRKLRWYRRLYGSVDRVFVLSTMQRSETAERLGLPAERVKFVHFGVDAAAFAPELASDGDYVLVAGRDRSRDWTTVFEAARASSLSFKVLARPRDLEGLDPPSNVEVLGYLPFAEYRDLLLRARVVVVAVVPRPYPTGQTVLLEAMSAGKAVVVTETAGLADYLTGTNARTVPPRDPEELRRAIEEVFGDPSLRAALGEAGRQFVLDHATAERMWASVADELEAAGA
jgi:glycosyltransferase involved in cell wall biosynthesis